MAGGEPIDRLEIEIEATSTTAETRLNNVSKLLEGVRNSAARAVSPFKAIRDALNTDKQQKSIETINRAMEATAKGPSARLQQSLKSVSSGLDATKFAKSISRIDAEIDNTDRRIQTLKDRLEYLKMPVSGVSATGKLGVADEVAEAETKLKELEKVRLLLQDERASLWANMEKQGDTGGTQQAQQAADALAKGLKNADVQAFKTSRSLSDIQDRLAALERVKGFVKSSEFQTAATQARDYAEAVDAVNERVNALKTALADAKAGKLDLSSEGASQLVKDYQAAKTEAQYLGTAAGYALKDAERAAKSAGGEVSRLAAAFQNVKSGALSGLKGIGSYIGSSFTKPFRSAITTFGKWKSAIGRLALYRVIRSAIKMVTEGLKEGIQNLYYFSQLAGSQFSAAMDDLASSSLYLKNSLGAMAAPLIQAVAPAINFIIEKFVALLNVINAVFAALGGSTSFTKAVKTGAKFGDDLAGSMGGAAGSAKELKRYLIGIDELTVIQDMDTGGGGGGGGGLSADYGSMFETVEVPSTITDLAKRIKDAIAAGDWYGVGAILADKLNGIVANLDTNGWGLKLGEKITHGLQAAYGFLSNFSFSGLASKIADFVNGAFENLDFTTAGKLFVRKLTIIPDLLIGFFSTLDFGLVARSLSNFLTGAFDEATAWLKTYDWGKLGDTLWQQLKDMVANIDFAGIASSLFTFLGTAIQSAAKFLGSFFGSVAKDVKKWWNDDIKGENWQETAKNLLSAIGQGFKDIGGWVMEHIVDPFCSALLGKDTWADLKESGENIIEGLWEGITNRLSDVKGWLKKHLVDPIVNGVKKLFGIASPSTVFKAIGAFLIDGLFAGISDTWRKVTDFFSRGVEWIRGIWDSIKGKTVTLTAKVEDATAKVREKVVAAWEYVKSGTETLKAKVQLIKSKWKSLEEFVGDELTVAVSLARQGWNSLKTWLGDKMTVFVSLARSGWSSLKGWIGDKLTAFVSLARSGWNSLTGWIGDRITAYVSLARSGWSSLSSWVGNAVSVGVSLFKSGWSSLSSWIGSKINVGVSLVKSGWSSLKSWIGLSTGGIFTGGSWQPIQGYASGGNPKRARLFYANENGMPELIGRIGGNTAVMNNGQIVASVSSGVYRAVYAALGNLGGYFGTIANSMSRIPDVLSNIAPVEPQPILAGASGPAYEMDTRVIGRSGYDGTVQRGQEDQEEIINAIYAIGQRIISAINEKDTNLYFDTRKVGSSVTDVQNCQNRMYGKTLQWV